MVSIVKKHPRVDFDTRVKRQTQVITKIIEDSHQYRSYDPKGNRTPVPPPISLLAAVSERHASLNRDIESIRQMLPDIELAAQILVSSILSPKDLSTPHLTYGNQSDTGNEELYSKMLAVVEDYFTNDYKMNDQLSRMLETILFNKGAYVQMVIPESSLDMLINGDDRLTLESVKSYVDPAKLSARPIGLLGDEVMGPDSPVSLESLFRTTHTPKDHYTDLHEYLGIVDNPDAVKMSKLYDKIRRDKTITALSSRYTSLEARSRKVMNKLIGENDREIERKLQDQRSPQQGAPVVQVPTHEESLREETYGHPMVAYLSTEAVIPAYVPSNPENHIGYFVLLDQYGNPLNTGTVTDHYRDLQTSISEQGNSGSGSISSILTELRGGGTFDQGLSNITTVHQATTAFADLIERKLLTRVRKGLGHESIELSRPSDIYQIMLARICQKKRTQLLYVPVELMSYMAFTYDNQGVGKSLLEESRMLASMRVVLMFANTMAQIRNSTPRTELGIQLDPNDTDPLARISQVLDAFMQSRSDNYPLGMGDPSSIIGAIQRASVDVVYSGHEGLPDMKVESTDKANSRVLVDKDLEEQLRHLHIMSMGLSPETIDVSRGVNFATSLINSSLLLAKRVAIYQMKFETMLSDFICKYTKNSEPLIAQLTKIVMKDGKRKDKENLSKTIEQFVENIQVNLPNPDTVTLDAQMEAFDKYTAVLDKALEAWISDEFVVADADGDVSGYLAQIRVAIRAYYVRKWLRDNNVVPELEEITAKDEDGKPVFDFAEIQGEHMNSVLDFVAEYLKKARKASEKRDEKLKAEQADAEGEMSGNTEETGEENEGEEEEGNEGSEEEEDLTEEF